MRISGADCLRCYLNNTVSRLGRFGDFLVLIVICIAVGSSNPRFKFEKEETEKKTGKTKFENSKNAISPGPYPKCLVVART